MREYKFRAWDVVFNKWLYFTLESLCHQSDTGLINLEGSDRIVPWDNLEDWCQYTGFNDHTKWGELSSNEQNDWLFNQKESDWAGREIYKGDIVEARYWSGLKYEMKIEVVKFQEGAYTPRFWSWFDKEDAQEKGIDRIKIIGNLRENSEQLPNN